MFQAPRPQRTPKQRSERPVRSLSVFAGVLCVAIWGGCSVEKHYDLLSKFFDGVPDPNAPMFVNGVAIAQSSIYSEHRPYIEDSCFECHTDPSDMQLDRGDSSMCLKCHDGLMDQYPKMHGAVTGAACLMCHNPHMSAFPFLLRDQSPAMCTQCHEMETVNPISEHSDPERLCIDCHSGHGGEAAFFLKKIVEIQRTKVSGEGREGTDEP